MGHTNLTAKQAKFAEEYVANGGNATDAYRKVYNAKDPNSNTIYRRAHEVLTNSKVAARIKELQEEVKKSQVFTVEQHLATLAELRDKAKEANQYGAAIKAEEARGKVAGFYTQKVDLSSSDGSMSPQPSKTDEEIVAWLKQRYVKDD